VSVARGLAVIALGAAGYVGLAAVAEVLPASAGERQPLCERRVEILEKHDTPRIGCADELRACGELADGARVELSSKGCTVDPRA
jgi:hypothetical protein